MTAAGSYPWAPGYYDDGDRPTIVSSRFGYEHSYTLERYHATGNSNKVIDLHAQDSA